MRFIKNAVTYLVKLPGQVGSCQHKHLAVGLSQNVHLNEELSLDDAG